MYIEGDVPSVVTGGSGGAGSGFGWGSDAWVLIILFALIFGWGNNGWGGNGGSSGSVMDAYVLNSDFATLQRLNESGFDRIGAAVNQVNNGLCQGFYQEAQLINGVNMNIANEFRGVDNAICGVQSQLATCCCDLKSGIESVKYENAKNTCDIIRAGQDNTRAILDYLSSEKIASLQAENAGLKAQISNDKQSAYLINQLRPCPIPAYQTCNPWAGTSNTYCGCGL